MRDSQTCPKCEGRKLYVVDPVKQPDPARVARPLVPATGLVLSEGAEAVLPVEAGTFQAWICAKCGYTEFYARDANEVLEILAQLRNQGVRIVENESVSKGPYR
jgi:predicted nucleic-acid-binding Zn-ribbon protein